MNSETVRLLDQLYDLKKEDSSLILSIDKEKQENVTKRDELITKRDELQGQLDSLCSEEKVLASEGEDLKIALAKVTNGNYATILKKLEIEFDPYSLGREVERKLPIVINEVANQKESTINELNEIDDNLSNTILKIDELDLKHDEFISNQLRLKHYFDLSMHSEINITRDEMVSLLLSFDMNVDDARETAKLLMFPEDGLFEYDENINNNRNKTSMKEIFAKAREEYEKKETIIEKPVIEEETIVEEIIKEEEPVIEPITIEEPVIEVKEEVIPVSKESISKEELINYLNSNNIDSLNFTNNDFEILLNNYNKEIFDKNIKLVNDIKINSDIFADNVELLFDKELENKVELLLEVGKSSSDIYLNPNVLVKYNLDKLKEAVEVLKANNLNPKDIPLIAY